MNILLKLVFQDDEAYEGLVDFDRLDTAQQALINGALENSDHTVHTDGDTMVELVIDIEHTAGVPTPAAVAHSVTIMEIDEVQYEEDKGLLKQLGDHLRGSEC